jgi:allantoinase
MEPTEERQSIHRALAKIAALAGRKPVGWLGSGLAESWNTLDNLADEGVQYIADWVSDDQPFFITLDDGRKLVSIPYSYEINDSPFIQTRAGHIDQFVAAIKRQFDTLYAEGAQSGRVMAICLHPYLIGVPHRIQGLDEALAYIAAHDGVWFATGSEIVRAWLQSGATF